MNSRVCLPDRVAGLACLGLFFVLGWSGAGEAGGTEPEGVAAKPVFVQDLVPVSVGETRMVAVRVEQAQGVDLVWEMESSDPGVVEVIRQPEILAGHHLGFARLRGAAGGEATLSIGDARVPVVVVGQSEERGFDSLAPPRFTAPAEGAAAWGVIGVGAEVHAVAPGPGRDHPPHLRLRLPDGSELEPVALVPPVDGPFWRAHFELDTMTLSPGANALQLVARPAAGTGSGGPDEPTRELASPPRTLLVLGDSDAADSDPAIAAGECEDTLDTPRTQRMGENPPPVVIDSGASNHRAVLLQRGRPAWVFAADIPENGRYQLMVRARGTLAGGVYPSLGLVTGERADDRSASAVAGDDWHWMPVGVPVPMEAGEIVAGVRLVNDFRYRNQIERRAEVDAFALRHVPPGLGGSSGGGGGMEMMQGGGEMAMQEAPADGRRAARRGNRRVARGLVCAFTTLEHDRAINGRVDIRAFLNSQALRNDDQYRNIRTDLLVNGEVIGSAHGRHPSFALWPHDLAPGANTLQAVSLAPCGTVARSANQVLHARASGHPTEPLAVEFNEQRHLLGRGPWRNVENATPGEEGVPGGDDAPEQAHVLIPDGAEVEFEVPANATGERRLSVLVAGMGEAAGSVEMILRQPEARHRSLRELRLPARQVGEEWAWLPVAALELEPGPKTLVIRGTGEAVAFGGISAGTPYFVDASPPEAILLYPREGATLSATGDALVIEAFDDVGLRDFEVWIDGEALSPTYPLARQTGPILLPLPASALQPGARTISVHARDHSGKSTEIPSVEVEVRESDSPQLDLAYPRAVRLAKRLAFGPDADTLAAILVEGEEQWLEAQLAPPPDSCAHEDLIAALAGARFTGAGAYQVRGRAVSDLLLTRYPVRARFTLFASNHFSTWIAKTGAPAAEAEYAMFRRAGVASFRDLLFLSATSPAMLVYLDQHRSLARQTNENYARELMELHTVGVHGGYTQDDVTALSRLLAGWGAQREAMDDGMTTDFAFRFSPFLTENEAIDVFGLRVPPFDRPEHGDDRVLQVLEMLTARPATARMVADKLAVHYLGESVCETVKSELAADFQNSGGDMRRMLQTIAFSDAMMARDLPPRLLPPVDFGVATQRAVGVYHPWSVVGLSDRSGRALFDRASPDGYPDADEEVSDSNTRLQLWNFCREIEQPLATGLQAGWFSDEALARDGHLDALLCRAFAARFGIAPLPTTREAVHALFEEAPDDAGQRRLLFATFLHMLPEAQWR